MTSKLIPADPSKVMVIRQLSPSITTCSAPFERFGRIKVGGRGTIVRLQSGALAIFSPTALTPEVRSTLTTLGNDVQYLSALDLEHHLYLTEWSRAFPSARVLGIEGLPEKRALSPATAGTTFHHLFTAANRHTYRVDPAFDAEFDYEYVAGHANKELVFWYKREKTLIQADLIFNLPAYEQYSRTGRAATEGVWTRLFTAFQNTAGEAMGQRRFVWYVAGKERESFDESVRRIDGWDFERIVPCHGDVIETGGKEIFRKVMDWHLQKKKE